MVLAFSIWAAFWSILWFFLLFMWIFLVIQIFFDIFRSDDIGGWGKALWSLFIIILPFLGVLVYLIARGGKMQERRINEVKEQQAAANAYIREVAGTPGASTADELAKLAELKQQGAISEEEFQAGKAKILSS